jgi:predicted protein tyrosine phosphatase
MLNPDSAYPELGTEYAGRHLRLAFHDVNVPAPDEIGPSAEHIRSLLGFVEPWDSAKPMLIHCRTGISRSTAAAYVVACAANPESDEYAIAVTMRHIAPLARPRRSSGATTAQ